MCKHDSSPSKLFSWHIAEQLSTEILNPEPNSVVYMAHTNVTVNQCGIVPSPGKGSIHHEEIITEGSVASTTILPRLEISDATSKRPVLKKNKKLIKKTVSTLSTILQSSTGNIAHQSVTTEVARTYSVIAKTDSSTQAHTSRLLTSVANRSQPENRYNYMTSSEKEDTAAASTITARSVNENSLSNQITTTSFSRTSVNSEKANIPSPSRPKLGDYISTPVTQQNSTASTTLISNHTNGLYSTENISASIDNSKKSHAETSTQMMTFEDSENIGVKFEQTTEGQSTGAKPVSERRILDQVQDSTTARTKIPDALTSISYARFPFVNTTATTTGLPDFHCVHQNSFNHSVNESTKPGITNHQSTRYDDTTRYNTDKNFCPCNCTLLLSMVSAMLDPQLSVKITKLYGNHTKFSINLSQEILNILQSTTVSQAVPVSMNNTTVSSVATGPGPSTDNTGTVAKVSDTTTVFIPVSTIDIKKRYVPKVKNDTKEVLTPIIPPTKYVPKDAKGAQYVGIISISFIFLLILVVVLSDYPYFLRWHRRLRNNWRACIKCRRCHKATDIEKAKRKYKRMLRKISVIPQVSSDCTSLMDDSDTSFITISSRDQSSLDVVSVYSTCSEYDD